MKRCVMCKAEQPPREGHAEHRLPLDGFVFEATLPALVCDQCGESYTEGQVLGWFELASAAWLTANGHCTPVTFKFVRKALGLSGVKVAELMGVAAETVSRWENGHQAIPAGNFALLGGMVADRLEGREDTMRRLQALKAPAKAPRRAVRLELPKAG